MRRLKILARKWRSFRSYAPFEQVLAPVALLLLGLARLAALLLPFRFYAPVLGRCCGLKPGAAPMLDESARRRARGVGRVVRATAAVTPWRSMCLEQALAACVLLRLFGLPYIARLGVAKAAEADPESSARAHAWVMAGKVAVTGGRENDRHAPVAVFMSEGWRRAVARDSSV